MLDAYSQLFITHSGFAVENWYFAICPPASCIIRDIFTGMEKNINSYNSIHCFHICIYHKSVSKKVISLVFNILRVGYLSLKLKSIY